MNCSTRVRYFAKGLKIKSQRKIKQHLSTTVMFPWLKIFSGYYMYKKLYNFNKIAQYTTSF